MDERWVHARPLEPHEAKPDLTRSYTQRGTGQLEAPCLTCSSGEVVIRVVEDGNLTDRSITGRAGYDALCVHGPASPDRCGHPDCVGARTALPESKAVTIRQQGTVPLVQHVPAFAWRCNTCGWLGLGHMSEAGALKEASDHMWDDHEIALCASINDKKQYGHPGHRWHHVKGSDSTDQCERCHEYIGK